MGQVHHGEVDELYLDKVLDLIAIPRPWSGDTTFPTTDLTFNNAAQLFGIEVPPTGSQPP